MASSSLRAIRRSRQIISRASFTPSIAPVRRREFRISPRSEEKKFTKDHEWIELAADGKTGISFHLQPIGLHEE